MTPEKLKAQADTAAAIYAEASTIVAGRQTFTSTFSLLVQTTAAFRVYARRTGFEGSGKFLAAIEAFLASPEGQALEAARMKWLTSLIPA